MYPYIPIVPMYVHGAYACTSTNIHMYTHTNAICIDIFMRQ